jgi:hypothetical protein
MSTIDSIRNLVSREEVITKTKFILKLGEAIEKTQCRKGQEWEKALRFAEARHLRPEDTAILLNEKDWDGTDKVEQESTIEFVPRWREKSNPRRVEETVTPHQTTVMIMGKTYALELRPGHEWESLGEKVQEMLRGCKWRADISGRSWSDGTKAPKREEVVSISLYLRGRGNPTGNEAIDRAEKYKICVRVLNKL